MTTAPLEPRQTARVIVPFAFVTLVWSSTWIVIRDQIAFVPPSWSIAYRFGIAGAVMLAYLLATRRPLALDAIGWRIALAVGVLQFVLNFGFVYAAEAHITSGLVAVIFALLVVPNAVFARIFLGQGVSRRFVAGSAVALLGVALLFAQEWGAAVERPGSIALGIAWTLFAVLAAAGANVIQGSERMRARPIVTVLCWAMLIGAAIDAAYAGAIAGPPQMDWRWSYIAGLLYLGIVASTIAFALYYNVIRAIGPARAAYSSVLVPVIAMTLSTVFEGYRWSRAAAMGGVLVLLGLVVAIKARSPAR